MSAYTSCLQDRQWSLTCAPLPARTQANAGGNKRRGSAALREAKMIAGLPVPVAAWWALILVLIAFISWVLTKLGIHICRGSVFNTVGGRAAVVILFVHLADTDEGVVSQSVFLTNIFFDPFVRFLRWSNGLLTNQRRNSRVPASVFYIARLPQYLAGSATWPSRASSTSLMCRIYLEK